MTTTLTELNAISVALLAFVTLQRLAELVYARRNEARLLARGAIEHGAAHYPAIVALHAAWLIGLWWLASGLSPQPLWVLGFLLLQALRVWVLASLGPRWTTRIIVLPGAPLVKNGPYRLISHPNYIIVALEIFVLPMAYGLWLYALLFSALNAGVLAIRIRAEESALKTATPGKPE